jgi:hypothetical protein
MRAMNSELKQRLNSAIVRSEQIRRGMSTVAGDGPAQLPLWDERMRGIPNCLTRSALFSCKGKNVPRIQLKGALIASTAGVQITASTEDLRQEESDVFLMLVHLARMHKLGDLVEVTAYHMLKAMNWCAGSADYARLRACITRLTEATIWVKFDGDRGGFSGRLVERVEWADAGSGSRERWRIKLDRQILHLFGDTDFTLIDWEKRLELRTLAKWLHNYYASHRDPLPISVGRLYELCGSSNKRLSGFRSDLTSSLDELRRIDFLLYWSHDPKSDLVMVKRHQPNRALSYEPGPMQS